jgi:hypothetical protein
MNGKPISLVEIADGDVPFVQEKELLTKTVLRQFVLCYVRNGILKEMVTSRQGMLRLSLIKKHGGYVRRVMYGNPPYPTGAIITAVLIVLAEMQVMRTA